MNEYNTIKHLSKYNLYEFETYKENFYVLYDVYYKCNHRSDFA